MLERKFIMTNSKTFIPEIKSWVLSGDILKQLFQLNWDADCLRKQLLCLFEEGMTWSKDTDEYYSLKGETAISLLIL